VAPPACTANRHDSGHALNNNVCANSNVHHQLTLFACLKVQQMVETTAYLVSRTAASICCPPPHPEQGSFKNKPVKKPFVTDPGTACAAAQGMDMVLPTMWSVTCQLYKTSQGICCIWCCKDMMAYATGSSQEELLHQAYQMCCLRLPDTGSCSRLKGSSLGLNPG